MRIFYLYLISILLLTNCGTEEKNSTTATNTPAVQSVEELVDVAKDGGPTAVYELTRADYIDRAKLYDSTMTIYSDIMPLMIRFNKLRSGLAVYSSEEYAQKLDANLRQQMVDKLEELEQLNKTKMEWMNQFDRHYEQKPHQEAMEYLNEKKAAILTIKENLSLRLDEAAALLEKVKQ